MCHDLSKFFAYAPLKHRNHSITIPNGRNIPTKFIGQVQLINGIVLSVILYVPHFKFNLIAVSKIVSDMMCLVSFDTDKCYFQEPKKMKRFLLGKDKAGLYIHEDINQKANATTAPRRCTQTSATKSVLYKTKLRHLRMGHLPFSRLNFVFPKLTEHLVKPHMFCTICPLGKQTIAVCLSSTCKSQKPLELLHIIVWGLFRNETRNNCSMFITIVDDFSNMSWIFLIKQNF